MSKSFTMRLAVAFAAMGIAAAALTAFLVNVAFEGRFDSYLDHQRRRDEARLVAALHRAYERSKGWEAASLDSVGLSALMEGLSFRLEDASGPTVWPPSEGKSSRMAEMMDTDLHREMMGTGPLGPERRLPVMFDGAQVGTAVVRFAEGGVRPEDASLRASVNRSMLAAGLVAGLVALVVGAVLARRATAPVEEITRTARDVAAGDRSRRVASGRSDELGEMGRAFNQMADAIEEQDRLRQVFAGDVAHELRTPLAILRSQLEALQDGVTTPTPAALASLHEEVLRLSRLVDDLEVLASADAAGFSLDRQPVHLRPLLDEAARTFLDAFEAEGVALELDLADDVVADADPTRLRQITSNLLSNAVKFSRADGRVRLELEREGEWAVIRVCDDGPGIPHDELERVFDRFFRGRRARAGGSGIGLAVVRQLVTAHGGDVQVSSQLGQGATFTVRLPLAPRSLTSFTVSS